MLGRVAARYHSTLTLTNFFRVLGMPEHFDLDPDVLASRFKSLQREWHPDKHASSRPGSDPAKAAQRSSLLNEAYHTLRDPHSRASHLLAIHGQDAHDPEIDPRFLAWVVQYREKIEAAESDASQIAQLKAEIDRLCQDRVASLGVSFSNNQLAEAAEHSAKLKYLSRMSSALEDMS